MKQFVTQLQAFALAAGGPGLFLIAFLDASVLSLPEINDLLIIWMVTHHKHRLIYYASMATLGSIAGSFLLYFIGRKSGDAMLKRRFHEARLIQARALFRRYGALAILIPSILPPPAPFKIFVLLAGMGAMPAGLFAISIAIGRGLRYFVEGMLAVRYGDRTMAYLRANGGAISLMIATAVVALALVYVIWRKIRRPPQIQP